MEATFSAETLSGTRDATLQKMTAVRTSDVPLSRWSTVLSFCSQTPHIYRFLLCTHVAEVQTPSRDAVNRPLQDRLLVHLPVWGGTFDIPKLDSHMPQQGFRLTELPQIPKPTLLASKRPDIVSRNGTELSLNTAIAVTGRIKMYFPS
jgi:hypothetical protein